MRENIWKEQRETILAIIFCIVVGGPIVWLIYQPLPDAALSEPYSGTGQITVPFLDELSQLPEFLGRVPPEDVEPLILKYTNEERQKHGVAPLEWDDQLSTIARRHSQDMVDNNYFSHDNLQGDDPTDRARKYGYPLRKNLGGGWYSDGIGENIGKMPTGNVAGIGVVANTADAIARAQVDSWMKSPGHKQNILDPQYSRLGVGVAHDGHQYYYSTQNFW